MRNIDIDNTNSARSVGWPRPSVDTLLLCSLARKNREWFVDRQAGFLGMVQRVRRDDIAATNKINHTF